MNIPTPAQMKSREVQKRIDIVALLSKATGREVLYRKHIPLQIRRELEQAGWSLIVHHRRTKYLGTFISNPPAV